MILFISAFILQTAAFPFLPAALMFPNHFVPGTRGKRQIGKMLTLASELAWRRTKVYTS